MNEKKRDYTAYIRTAVCKKCGQTFIPAPMHIFKEHGKYYCKWTCYDHRHDKTKEGTAYEDNQDRPAEGD